MLSKIDQSAVVLYAVGFLGQVVHRRQPTLFQAPHFLRFMCLRPFDRKLELAATALQLLGLYLLLISGLQAADVLSAALARYLYMSGFLLLMVTIIVDLAVHGRWRPGA